MRILHPGLQAHLAGGATTLARCWTLTRRDGVTLGFTDHDRDITLAGVIHQAGAAIDPSELSVETGFGAGGADAVGALRSGGVTEADISAGLYDSARVELRLVNWSDTAARQLLDVYEIGEIRRGPDSFTVELRSLAHRYDEERGRIYAARCDADLGDARCGVANPPLTASVLAVESGGRLRLGANAGHAVEIREHELVGTDAVISPWIAPPRAVAAGDAVTVTRGCDKSFDTCAGRFGNTANFRGFPHIPGNDFLLQTAGESGAQTFDGGSLFR
jgi:uncharacterized phage protein (TIGR02218 family)